MIIIGLIVVGLSSLTFYIGYQIGLEQKQDIINLLKSKVNDYKKEIKRKHQDIDAYIEQIAALKEQIPEKRYNYLVELENGKIYEVQNAKDYSENKDKLIIHSEKERHFFNKGEIVNFIEELV